MWAIIQNVSVLNWAPISSSVRILSRFDEKEHAEKELAELKKNSVLSESYSLYDSVNDNPHYVKR